MSTVEVAQTASAIGHQLREALARLLEFAQRGDAEAALVETAASQLVGLVRPVDLPVAERALWNRVGAAADLDVDARVRSVGATAAAATKLTAASIIGRAAMGETLGVSPSRISQLVRDRALFEFEDASGAACYPRWQVTTEGRPLRGMAVVLGAVRPGVHPLVVHTWFTTPNADLALAGASVSPVEWLASGGDPSTLASLAAEL